MEIVSDVHGEFGPLPSIARRGQLLVLGDLVNLIDYRTLEGIVPEVVGSELVSQIASLRAEGREEAASELWSAWAAKTDIDVRSEVASRMRASYEEMRAALTGTGAIVIHGNVDDPVMLAEYLPDDCRYVDGEVLEIEGASVGFVGGGIERIGSRGEVSDETMTQKLSGLGAVDILCTHVAPAIDTLAQDVLASHPKGSRPVLEYIDAVQPAFHFFGDIHQPRATRWRRGRTTCVNVGYFRATGRSHRHS